MKNKLILPTIVLIILQIILIAILFRFDNSIIITFNNKEFNEILNNNTLYGFQKSNFIFALNWTNQLNPKTAKITVYNGRITYKLDERGIDNEISNYIRGNSNIRQYILGTEIILVVIYIILIKKLK